MAPPMHLELHCHTSYSRGRKVPYEAFMTPEELVQTARARGLSAVAITDHDTCKAWPRAAAAARKTGILFIPACEVSSSAGHIIGLGMNEAVRPGLPPEETISRIRSQGAVALAPHPFDLQHTGLRENAVLCDSIEIFNALAVDRFSNSRNQRLASRHHLPSVVGSDAHLPEALGLAVNILQADSLDSCLHELKAGRVTHTVRYQSPALLTRWAYLRLSHSRQPVEQYIRSYSQPKKWLSQKLLQKFVSSPESRKWQALAKFGISSAIIYSIAKNRAGLF